MRWMVSTWCMWARAGESCVEGRLVWLSTWRPCFKGAQASTKIPNAQSDPSPTYTTMIRLGRPTQPPTTHHGGHPLRYARLSGPLSPLPRHVKAVWSRMSLKHPARHTHHGGHPLRRAWLQVWPQAAQRIHVGSELGNEALGQLLWGHACLVGPVERCVEGGGGWNSAIERSVSCSGNNLPRVAPLKR